MKRNSKIDVLLQADGWKGTATRFGIMGASAVGIYYLPWLYAWYSEHFLSKPLIVNEQRTFEFFVVGVLLGVTVLCEIVNTIRIFRAKGKTRDEQA